MQRDDAIQTYTMTLTALARSISSTEKTGHTDYIFVAVPVDGGYSSWRRPQDLPQAIVTAQAGFSHSSDDRHSATEVQVRVPVGALRKRVRKDLVRRGSTTTVERLTAGGSWQSVKHVGNQKDNGGGWVTVIEIDGQRVRVAS